MFIESGECELFFLSVLGRNYWNYEIESIENKMVQPR